MDQRPHIAVVDDHQDIRELVARYLGQHGFRVSTADGADAFRRLLERGLPDLAVLDIMMPGEDGLALCRQLRTTSRLPIIFLTAMAEDTDRIIGLELGGDDYLAKPFNPRELLARIKAVLRRTAAGPAAPAPARAERVRIGGLIVDLVRREVTGADGVAVPLSTVEFRLLCVLIERPDEVLSRDQLIELTSGRGSEVWDRSIDSQISRLRRKIEADPRNPVLIRTHWGGGYCFTGRVEDA